MVTKETLEENKKNLEIARMRYKPGTIYIPINHTTPQPIIKSFDYIDHFSGGIGVGMHCGLIYLNGKWAKIIKESNQIIEVW